MRRSFLAHRPAIVGILAGQTPNALIAECRNAAADGAHGVAIDLSDLKPEFRHVEALKPVVGSVPLPVMCFFYRQDRWQASDDDQRQEVLLAAAAAGASMIDVMGDLYDPSPMELSRSQQALDRQRRIIDRYRSLGAQVVVSSHMTCARSTEQVLEHMHELERRGADVVKMVTQVDTADELAEAVRTTTVLHRTLSTPFIHLCSGVCSRPHRFLSPVLGGAIHFAVSRYEPQYLMPQPTIRAMRAVVDGIGWNIADVVPSGQE